MMFVQISKGRRRRDKEEDETSSKDENDETNTSQGNHPPEEESTEAYSTVDLSPKQESEGEESKSSWSSRSDRFFDRLKCSSMGKIFKNDSKHEGISIYTIDQSVRQAPEPEERLEPMRSGLRRPSEMVNQGRTVCVASQANDYPPYRLYFLPSRDWRESQMKFLKLLTCQCCLASFLLIWLLSGAITFYFTEGPFEEQLIEELNTMENSTMVSMATDLRMLDPELEPWDDVLIKYTSQHREELISLIKFGYKNDTIVWTFPGSILCAVSLLTSLGLAAPLPQTSGGLIGGIIFVLLGFPIHLAFIIHLGRTIATRVQLFAKEAENKASSLKQRIIHVRRFGEDKKRDVWREQLFTQDFKPPSWLAYFPFISTFVYYLIGFLVFGIARGLPTLESFLFFICFSRGYPSNGFSRMGYSWYLEGGAILTGLNVAIFRDSPITGYSGWALQYDLITNSLE